MIVAAALALGTSSARGASFGNTTASFTGGGVVVTGTRYAKAGDQLTLTVATDSGAQCVDITGAFSSHQTSLTGKSTWTFTFVAPSGDGTKTVTATAYDKFDKSGACTGATSFGADGYTLDNTAPSVTGTVSPAANLAGWNKSNVSITWSAVDNGSGVASGPNPATDSVTTDTPFAGVTRTATATDRVGNTGSGSALVKRDTGLPTITHLVTPAPTSFGWNNQASVAVAFNCADILSLIKSCAGGGTATAVGPTPFTGTATDNADNTTSDSVTVQIDRTKPTVAGVATTSPNANGWYSGNVTVHWTAVDNIGVDGSGVDPSTIPGDTVVTGEGSNLSAGPVTVADKAGNISTGASVTGIKIDRTPPNTVASAPNTNWNNQAVTVTLSGSDNLSAVAATHYALDGGADTIYSALDKIPISSDGEHTLTFWSVDNAGNTEAAKTIQINIDRTPPTINHTQSPLANAKGWNRTDVTISYTCTDALSGIKTPDGCPVDKTIAGEGLALPVGGTALDNAGNSTGDLGTVSIDRTSPMISAAAQGTASVFGWYNAPVVVKFTCADTLSGVASCAADRTLSEGTEQSGSGESFDNAGNAGTGSFSAVSVDTTAPALSGAPTADPNADGWYNGDITVHWTAADALSGVVNTPDDSVVTGEGDALSASASVSDKAGNSETASVAGLKIDRTAPNTTATPTRVPDYNGWYTGSVGVTLNPFDGLSGVHETLYSVDGGGAQTYSAPFAFDQGGVHTIRFWSSDKAGNVEARGDDAHALTLQVDNIKPSIVATRIPNANGFGWNNGAISVVYDCSDDESGLDPADCPPAASISTEGMGQSITGSTKDRAGNIASATVSGINIDLTAPTLSGEPTTAPNANGWYNGDVTVHWTPADALSGIDDSTVPAARVVTGEGGNLSTGVVSVFDKAGNKSEATLGGIEIDRTPPNTQVSVPTDPDILRNGWYTGPLQVSLLAADALSGVDKTLYSLDGGDAKTYDGSFQFNAGGVHTIRFWSVDQAGNVEDKTAAGNSITLKIDNLNPTIGGARRAGDEANGNGWNNGSVSVDFACGDEETGIKSCVGHRTFGAEGAAQSVTGIATDFAGNQASDTVGDINIDLTKPTLTGAATTVPNVAGWYNGDVTIHWTGNDVLSGIDDSTAPADSTITGEGDNLGAGPVTINDKAGNESAPASIGGIKIDRTAPTVTGAPTTQPNGNGWYTKAVTVDFNCTDSLSGVASCPSEKVLSDNGADQHVTSAAVFDNAGNEADGVGVGGINIDGLAPQTTAKLDCGLDNSYCRGATATVVLTATDQPGLSGVAALHYSVDGGADQVIDGAGGSVDVPLSRSGTATVSFHAVDKADNVEADNSVELKYDNIAPTVTHTLNPDANASGWNNANATVHFLATDDFSGIARISDDILVSDETAGRDVVGTADDVAGNTGTDTAHVMLDKTSPTISGSRAPAANPNGWNNEDVTVSFSCDDSMSGVAVCPDPVTLTQAGRDQSVKRAAKDHAGNVADTTVGGINVDKTKPALSGAATTAPNAHGWYKGDVTIQWTATDDLSGVDPNHTPSDDTITAEGDNLSASAMVADEAGNWQSAKVDAIRIDRTAPQTTVSVPAPLAGGWYADKVPVTLTATDALSGIDATYYSVDGADAKPYEGIFDYDVRGTHTLSYWSIDRAGNVEAKASKQLKVDDVPPTISATTSPKPTAYGWNNGDVTAHFACSDAESGIVACENAYVFHNEGANQSFTGTATDQANNTASTLVSGINIDRTPPTLVGQATTRPNAAGWYNRDVTINWLAEDGLSGIDPASVPADSTITGEGSSLSTPNVSVKDKAGNEQTASVTGVQIDRTAPTITPAMPAPNAAGWYSGAVTVKYNCDDSLSGVASCPQSQTLSGDGAGQSVTSDDATDVAGNIAAGVTAGGINIDSKAPVSTADNHCTKVNDWCTGDTATVVISAVDQSSLSGVKAIRYSVNGGAYQVAAGASATVNVPLNGSGNASVNYSAVDNAGNAELVNGVSLKWDNIAPTLTHTLDPLANGAGWDNANTTVHFDAKDDAGGSGIDAATVTPDQVVAAETAGLDVNGQAFDYAGNKGSDKAAVKLDKTPPTIRGAATTQPNANGWYSGPMTVHFACGDNLSGIASCPTDVILTSDGANQQVKGTAIDNAGNRTDTLVSGINIDTAKPALSFTGVANGGIYTLGNVPAAGCTATDTGGSGLTASCKVTVSGGSANGVGTYTVSAQAVDVAGNSATGSITYKVVYRWDGFLQPINDTAHQVGLSTSIFKGGSTVPAKFQPKKFDGTVVQTNALPSWLTPLKGSSMSAPVSEDVYGDAATVGGIYTWDPVGQQYQYNWNTKGFATGAYWRVGVTLDDGQTYYVNLGLR